MESEDGGIAYITYHTSMMYVSICFYAWVDLQHNVVSEWSIWKAFQANVIKLMVLHQKTFVGCRKKYFFHKPLL